MSAVARTIAGWFAGSALKALLWGAIAVAVAAVLLGARDAGRNAERVEAMRRSLEGARRRVASDADVDALDDPDLDDRLRHPARRGRRRVR